MSDNQIPIIDFPNTSSGKHAVYPSAVDASPELCMRDVLIKRLLVDYVNAPVDAANAAEAACDSLISYASGGYAERLAAIREIFAIVDGQAIMSQSLAPLLLPSEVPPESNFYRHAGFQEPQK